MWNKKRAQQLKRVCVVEGKVKAIKAFITDLVWVHVQMWGGMGEWSRHKGAKPGM